MTTFSPGDARGSASYTGISAGPRKPDSVAAGGPLPAGTTCSRPTVFVVDDDAETRDVLCALATAEGLAAETYADAPTFLKAFQAGRCGCLVLDVRLEGMSGLELQKELTARGIGIPVIITIGYDTLDVAIQAMKAGAFDVVAKPFLRERLVASIRQAVAWHVEVCAARAESQEVRRRYASLTTRERQVLELVVAGTTSRAIASRLGLREKTVQVYRSHINQKMKAHNAAELTSMLAGLRSPG